MAEYFLQKSGSARRWLLLGLLFFIGIASLQAQQLVARNVPIDDDQWMTKKISLKQLLAELENTHDVKFAFDELLIKDKFVEEEGMDTEELNLILTKVLTPLKLHYKKLTDRYYVIKQEAEVPEEQSLRLQHNGMQSMSVASKQLAFNQPAFLRQSFEKTISGTVTDSESGEALPGVNVLAKNTTTGTVTDVDGAYRLTVSDDVEILVFSSIGFLSEEVEIANQTQINVSMSPDVQSLEEVVVVGYGTVRKSDLTGSVVSVRNKELTAIPVTNGLEVLQGKVAGLDLTRSSGQPGASLNFTLRGNRSLNASNTPLVLVDGIQYGSTLDVNPNDIESIEVLKDASATAIYGSRGANGVILITTKRGVSGKANISVNSYYGIQSLNGYADIMSGPEWVDLRREARRTVGEWNGPEDDANIFNPTQLENFRNGIYTDWADELLGSGSQQNHQIGVSGGSDRTTYYLSMEYFNEKGLIRNDELSRYSGRLTVDYKAFDNLTLSTNLMYTFKDRDERRDPLNQANKMSPLGRPYDDEGNFQTFPVGDASTLNPLVDERPGNYVNNNRDRRFFANLTADWKIADNLTFTSRLGIDLSNDRTGYYSGTNTIDAGPDGLSIARAELGTFSQITWENFLNYSKTVGVHDLQFLIGSSMISNRTEGYLAEGRDVLSPTMFFNNLGATQTARNIGSELIESQLGSYFGRLNYKLLDKYLLTLVMRADGASVLAPGNKWGYFPSAAFSWLIKEENFMSNIDLVSELKLRVSYGLSGSSAVDPYQTMGALAQSTYAFDQGTNEVPAFGFYPGMIAAPNLGWETTATTNIGLDFGFLSNRIMGALDIYQQDTRDLLMRRNLPTSTGFRDTWDNIGQTRNRGIELQMSTVNIDNAKGFRWNSDITFNANREEIRKLSTGDRDLSNNWFVGHPINVFYDYEKIGLWQLGEEDAALENQQLPGEIKVRDQDGDGIITPEDRVILGTSNPRFSLGFNNRLTYKGVEFAFFLYSRVGQMITSEAAGSYKIDALENGPMVDYWTPENPTNDYPRPNAGTSRASTRYYSTLQYEDGSFVKLRDVTLAYNFPNTLLDRLSLSRLRVYATAKNYFVLSDMAPYDPERGGNLSFPMTRQMVFGLNIGL